MTYGGRHHDEMMINGCLKCLMGLTLGEHGDNVVML